MACTGVFKDHSPRWMRFTTRRVITPERQRIWTSIQPGRLTPSSCTDSMARRSNCLRSAWVVVLAWKTRREIPCEGLHGRALLRSEGEARFLLGFGIGLLQFGHPCELRIPAAFQRGRNSAVVGINCIVLPLGQTYLVARLFQLQFPLTPQILELLLNLSQ